MENELDRFDKSEKEVIPLNTDLITEELKKYDIQIVFGNSNDKKEIEIPKDKLTGLTPILNTIPGLLSNYAVSQSYSGAYKIVFQNGLKAGERLMQMGNGLRTTAIVDAQGKITGQAGLAELSSVVSIGPQITYAFFSAASVVTGQYFLAQINNNLKKISKDVKDIIAFLEISKASDLESNIDSLNEICEQLSYIPDILQNNTKRGDMLNKIQGISSELKKSFKFYDNMLSAKTNKKQISKEDLDKIFNFFDSFCIALSGYLMSIILELIFSFDHNKIIYWQNKINKMEHGDTSKDSDNEKSNLELSYSEKLDLWKNQIIELIRKSPEFFPHKKKYAGKIALDSTVFLGSLNVWSALYWRKQIKKRKAEYEEERKKMQNQYQSKVEKKFNNKKIIDNFNRSLEQIVLFDKMYSGPVALVVKKETVSLLISD